MLLMINSIFANKLPQLAKFRWFSVKSNIFASYRRSLSNMSTSTPSCRLVCLQRSHRGIPLPDGIAINIGRSPDTKIVDPRCSRNQVALTSNWSQRKVKVQQLGGNPSAIDGTTIGHKNEMEVGEEATIFILAGQYPHKVVFGENDTKETKDPKTSGHSSLISVKQEKEDEKKTPSKRPSSSSNGFPDAKKKKHNVSYSESKNHSDKRKEACIKQEDSVKSSKEGCEDGDSEEARLKHVASQLAKMKKKAERDKNTKSSVNESNKSSSSSSSLASNSSKLISSLPSSTSSSKPIVSKESVWTQHEHLHVFTAKGVETREKIAGFDVDGTIILTKSGKTFPTDVHDWRIAFPEIFGKLKQLQKEGYKLVFFTNQLGVARGKIKLEDLKIKLENIVAKLQVPIQVFVATHEGKYRKPVDGMWRKLKNQYNGGIPIDISSCVYIGDAAGRPVDWEPKKKKDFSSSDRLFAMNIGVNFKTPEEFFLEHKKAPFALPAFDPRKLSSTASPIPLDCKLNLDEKEVIVLVGFPASGKSHFAKHNLKPKGYTVVNRDTLGSWQKCVKATHQSLVNSSVVVDNTNLTFEERKRYLDCAKSAGVPCRCFLLTTTFDHCRHNEKFREMTDKSHAKINDIIFNQAKSKFKEPSLAEGFSEIVKVTFVPKFSSSTLAADYKKYILEK